MYHVPSGLECAVRSLVGATAATTMKVMTTPTIGAPLRRQQQIPRRLNSWEEFLNEEDMLFNGGTAAGGMRW